MDNENGRMERVVRIQDKWMDMKDYLHWKKKSSGTTTEEAQRMWKDMVRLTSQDSRQRKTKGKVEVLVRTGPPALIHREVLSPE